MKHGADDDDGCCAAVCTDLLFPFFAVEAWSDDGCYGVIMILWTVAWIGLVAVDVVAWSMMIFVVLVS